MAEAEGLLQAPHGQLTHCAACCHLLWRQAPHLPAKDKATFCCALSSEALRLLSRPSVLRNEARADADLNNAWSWAMLPVQYGRGSLEFAGKGGLSTISWSPSIPASTRDMPPGRLIQQYTWRCAIFSLHQ